MSDDVMGRWTQSIKDPGLWTREDGLEVEMFDLQDNTYAVRVVAPTDHLWAQDPGQGVRCRGYKMVEALSYFDRVCGYVRVMAPVPVTWSPVTVEHDLADHAAWTVAIQVHSAVGGELYGDLVLRHVGETDPVARKNVRLPLWSAADLDAWAP